MDVKPNFMTYLDADTVTAQGKNVKACEALGYTKLRGGNGTYIMVRHADAIINFTADGKNYEMSFKNLVKEYTNSKKITNNKAKNFFNEVSSKENIKLDFSDGKLSIVKIEK